MLKFVGCSRVLKHVVTCRSGIRLCPASSAVTSQFINTKSYRLYSTDAEEPRNRYVHGPQRPRPLYAEIFSIIGVQIYSYFRVLKNRIALPKNVELVIDTKRYRLYRTTDPDEPRKPGWFNQLSVIRSLKRLSKRIALRRRSNVQVVRPMNKKEDDDALYVIIPLYRVRRLEDVKVSVDRGTVFIQFKIDLEKHICWVDLPDIDLKDKIFKTGDIKAEYSRHHDLLKLIIPKLKNEQVVYNADIKTVYDKISYNDMFRVVKKRQQVKKQE